MEFYNKIKMIIIYIIILKMMRFLKLFLKGKKQKELFVKVIL